MRRYLRDQIIKLIPTIAEGVKYARKADIKNAVAVLCDCYTAVDNISTTLQTDLSAERFNFYEEIIARIVDLLEHIYQTITEGGNISDMSRELNNQLTIFQKELIKETEITLEILFLPYKSSMWDSLESIWLAAKDDPCCDCYVMPIPYYECNGGRSTKFHYEGDQFPENVPITPYDSYDISARKPDIIYIHNPYDEYNYVTSVDPRFYSHELKKHTDMLVYVPYFVLGGGNLSEAQLKLSVFQHMDKMVVQSERYKEAYRVYIPDNKLIVLGSPKIDKLIRMQKHLPTFPMEWQEAARNKKVVLYNTSISSILQEGIKALQKMEYVFSCLHRQDDVILLWRPHPLMEATLRSMRPDLYTGYLEIKKRYITEQIGIYDTTPDITLSVTFSDAYIGEETSSIVHLFGAAGKPIFLLKMGFNQCPTDEDLTSLSFYDCYFEQDKAWFVANGFNALCMMNLQTEKSEIVAKMPDDSPAERIAQYFDLLRVEDKIIMLPFRSSEICEYDIHKHTFQKTPLPDPAAYNFDRMVPYKKSLFMKPKEYPAILQYDLETGSCKYHRKALQEFRKSIQGKDMFAWGTSVRDNLLLMASSIVNKVLEFNMDTGTSKVLTVGSTGMNYMGMAFDGMDYWLIPNEGKAIVRWNYETGQTWEYSDYPEGFVGETRGFIGIVCCGKYLLAFPREANMIIRIDSATGRMSEFQLQLPYREGDRNSCYNLCDTNYYFVKKLDDQHVVALTSYDHSLLFINTDTGEYALKKCRLPLAEAEKYIRNQEYFADWSENIPYAGMESQYLSLGRFITDYVVSARGYDPETQKKAYAAVIDNLDGTCGEKTHQYIKEQIIGNDR